MYDKFKRKCGGLDSRELLLCCDPGSHIVALCYSSQAFLMPVLAWLIHKASTILALFQENSLGDPGVCHVDGHHLLPVQGWKLARRM